ncbi:glycosyl hydrolase [Sphingorhabdus lutea]|uniref:Beta-xylanase n=1 Tax=Sphingorhabdus lutea TaxID=1913578 RepID=A0A1L3JB05_9SPHN|nr:endo-1,4-beta-xylanase [Sphingorhabdus lutea]APG62324.1 glycosyl hydrolase [Sphingorhabdus lutea]
MKRREVMIGGVALFTAGCSTVPTSLSPAKMPKITGGLHQIGKARGINVGSATGSGPANSGSFKNPQYTQLLKNDCGMIVAENEMKWQAIRPHVDEFDFTDFDDQVAFARANNMDIRGHTLLWHRPEWMPKWLEEYDFGANPIKEAEHILTRHIAAVCQRYKGMIKSYDVVNETVLPENKLASTALSRAMGGTLELVDLAFHTARQHAPNTQLVYNDYMSWEDGNEGHRKGVLSLLEGFKKRGVPVDALGIQSHIRLDNMGSVASQVAKQSAPWREFLNEVTAMGYDILITEFDVNDQLLPADIGIRDAAVAAYAKEYLDLMFNYPQVKEFLLWGMCDPYSWLQDFKPLREDGMPKRPLPYDMNFNKKPLYDSISQSLSHAPKR